MWKAFSDLSNNKSPAINSDFFFLCLFLRRECGHPPRRGPGPLVMGAARAECRLRRHHGRWGRLIIRLSYLCLIPLTLGLITRPNAGPSKSIIMRRFLPFALRLRPTTLLSGAPFSRPPPAPLPSEKIGDIASIATKIHTLSETADTPLLTRVAV